MAYYEGEISGGLGGGNSGAGSNGDMGAWWIVILIVLFAAFGWGNNGRGGLGGGESGGSGNGSSGGGMQLGYDLGGLATKNDLASSFATNSMLRNQNDSMLQISGLQNQLCQDFGTLNTNILQTGNAIQSELASCCCQTQRAIDGVNYNLATEICGVKNAMSMNTRDIIDSQRASTDAILGFLTNEKISSLQTELTLAQSQLSQNAQTNNIVNALRPTPVPAYPVFSPYQSFAYPSGVAFGTTASCGCNGTTIIQ